MEKTSLISGDNFRHFRCTFLKLFKGFIFFGRSLVPACTISISGLDSRRFSNFSKIVAVVAPGKFFTFTVCCFESPLLSIMFNIESLSTKIFSLIWLLLDCCFEDLIIGFLCFDIVTAFELESQLAYCQQSIDLICPLSFK